MLQLSPAELEERARHFVGQLSAAGASSGLTASIIEGHSAVGGGSGPNVHPPTVLIALNHAELKAEVIEKKLRTWSPSVISRIADDLVLLDLRTVDLVEEPELLSAIRSLNS